MHDDNLLATEHREAAYFVQHLGQFGTLAIDIDPLRAFARLVKNVREVLQLKKTVRTDKGVDRAELGRGHSHAFTAS